MEKEIKNVLQNCVDRSLAEIREGEYFGLLCKNEDIISILPNISIDSDSYHSKANIQYKFSFTSKISKDIIVDDDTFPFI